MLSMGKAPGTGEIRGRIPCSMFSQQSGRYPWCGDHMSPGGVATLDACRAQGKPFLIVYWGATRPSKVVDWVWANNVRVLNVAGNRESTSPGIGTRAEAFMARVFQRPGHRAQG